MSEVCYMYMYTMNFIIIYMYIYSVPPWFIQT